jgi:hypothetical protein
MNPQRKRSNKDISRAVLLENWCKAVGEISLLIIQRISESVKSLDLRRAWITPLLDTSIYQNQLYFAYTSKGINYLQCLLTIFLNFYLTLHISQKQESSKVLYPWF